ncbi:ROK family transcriptional regulator [Deinococcus misasensis]|uniref:ROK family transcriptional regulator n=1 Tax=Deinococcus misasensis TaxID=392413 RepID=UPI0005530834|nr:ROK family transcriptional regulator [Deinococcus misasensis]
MTVLKGDQSTTRLLNRRLILNHIRKNGASSRGQLSEHTGLSPAAITAVTTELLQEELLTEVGHKRPVPLDIHYKKHHAIGVKLLEDRLEGVLTDLSTQVIQEITLDLPNHDPLTVARAIHHLQTQLSILTNTPFERIVGIGLGLPGLIDAERGVCIKSARFGWLDISLSSLISQHTQLPVWVDNDVNAYTTAERLYGQARHLSHFIVVSIGRGIGSGIVIDNKIHRGLHGAAGEFGHTLVQRNGRPCECGRLGCLEAYTSEKAILEHYQSLTGMQRGANITGLVRLAENGHEAASEVLAEAGKRLGEAIASYVNLLAPQQVILCGEGTAWGEPFFRPMREAYQQGVYAEDALHLPITVVEHRPDAWTRGAASLAVEHFFDFESSKAEITPRSG